MRKGSKDPVEKVARLLTEAGAAVHRLCGNAMTRLVENLGWTSDGIGEGEGHGFGTLAVCW